MSDEHDEAPTRIDIDRASVLEGKGQGRSGAENNELQVLWLHRWLWAKVQEKLARFRGDPERCEAR